MKDYEQFIEVNPAVLGGKPAIKGTRISVGLILNLTANGRTIEDIINEYPHLTKDQVQAAMHFAAERFDNEKEYTYV